MLHPSRWIPALIVLAYLAGFSGVLLSIVGNPANPRSPVGVAGIALMGIAFVALFVVSFSMVKFADGDEAN